MAINLEKMRQYINSKWPTWNSSERAQAERDYNEAVQRNAQEKAESEKKGAQRDAYLQQLGGTLAGAGATAYGTYLANQANTANTVAQGLNGANQANNAIQGANAANQAIQGANAVNAGAQGANAASGASTWGSTFATYSPYIAAALTAYQSAQNYRNIKKNNGGGDFTTDEQRAVWDPWRESIKKYVPREIDKPMKKLTDHGPTAKIWRAVLGSSKHDDQIKRDRVRNILEKEGFAEKQGKTHFIQLADGSYADIGHEDQVDAQGNSYKNYNLDVNDPLKQQSLALVNPIAHMFGGGDQKVSSDTAGILTNAFTSNAKNVDDVRANILSFLSKKGLSTEDIRANLQSLKDKGRISDEYFNVFSADLNKITDGLPASPIVNEQQVGAAPVPASAPIEPAKPLGQETPEENKKPFAPLENVNQNQAGFLKDQKFQPASNPFLQPSTSPGLMDLGSQSSQLAAQQGAQPFAGSLVGRGGVLTPNQPLVKPQGITIDPYRDPNNAGLIGLGQTQTPGIVRR